MNSPGHGALDTLDGGEGKAFFSFLLSQRDISKSCTSMEFFLFFFYLTLRDLMKKGDEFLPL